MARKSPKKPTAPFGYLNFSKSGRVEKRMFQLPHDKGGQELEVMNKFAEQVGKLSDGYQVTAITSLPEKDQDFLLQTSDGEITVQLTELVVREFATPISSEEYNSGRFASVISHQNGELLRVDKERRDSSIRQAIEKKVAKNYAKCAGEILDLIIFSTSSYLLTVYYSGGQRRESVAFRTAQNYAATLENHPFDRIWYFNMVTNPVKIWPSTEDTPLNANKTQQTDR
jgi:hypothetical protein